MNQRFNRPQGFRPYKKLFIVAVEGDKTEPNYFKLLKRISGKIADIQVIPSKKASAPGHVLKNLYKYLKASKINLRNTDELWAAVDADAWSKKQLQALYDWEEQETNKTVVKGVAVSNPKFELWLLLHFEDGHQVYKSNCDDRLRQRLPNYRKDMSFYFSEEQCLKAIARAKTKDSPPCSDCPREGVTTVYRLVERILCNG